VSINDVWRDLDKNIHVFQKTNFDDIPDTSGVYAWFYPIKVKSLELDKLFDEINKVYFYDSLKAGPPHDTVSIDFSWRKIEIDVCEKTNQTSSNLPQDIYTSWETISKNDEKFTILRKILMASSILMPPLYVGKAKRLDERCRQHRKSRGEKGTFKTRFEEYAKNMNLSVQSVDELIFVCVYTSDIGDEDNLNDSYDNPRSLVEEILKRAARPPYGLK